LIPNPGLFVFSSLSLSSLELIDTKVYEPEVRALLGTAAHFCEVVVLKSRTRTGFSHRFRGGLAFHAHSLLIPNLGRRWQTRSCGSTRPRRSASSSRSLPNLISKRLEFTNLVQENLLHRTIFVRNINPNVENLIETKLIHCKSLRMKSP
jgi:hypothetical protein